MMRRQTTDERSSSSAIGRLVHGWQSTMKRHGIRDGRAFTACIALWQAYACSDAHSPPASATRDRAATAVAGGRSGAARAAEIGSASEVTAGADGSKAAATNADGRTAPCSVSLPSGSAAYDACPNAVPQIGEVCAIATGLACVYRDPFAREQTALVLTCPADSPRMWKLSSSSCEHTCPVPATPVIEVAGTPCAQRAWQACREGLTAQSQLDATLGALLDVSGFAIGSEDTLILSFRDGCPTRFFQSLGAADAADATRLTAALGDVRLTCARELACAIVNGPSTLP
jgi:hypothetical protein